MRNIIRWVMVIPGAIISSCLINFPLHWLLYLKFAKNGTFLGFIEVPLRADISIEHIIYPFIMAITFILAGREIAPKYKFKTAIILFLIYTITWLIISIATSEFSIRSALAITGAIIGLYISKVKPQQKNS